MLRQRNPSAAEVMAVSLALNAPRSSSTVVAGSRRNASPSAAGMEKNRIVRSTRETVSTRLRRSPAASCSASVGNAAVESAIPNRATGRLAINHANVSPEMAEVPTFEAKNVVVTTKFACAAASPSTRGAISRATSRVGASPRSMRSP